MEKNRILLVEDEEDLVQTMLIQLKAAGYEVIVARDGLEGLDKAKKEKPDLIILDLMLPKIDGYKVCAMLKFNTDYQNIPVIIFTARAGEADKKMGTDVKADAYITKPFEPQALLSKIEDLLKGKPL